MYVFDRWSVGVAADWPMWRMVLLMLLLLLQQLLLVRRMMLMLLLEQPLLVLLLRKYVRLSVVLHGAADQRGRRLQGNAIRKSPIWYPSQYK